MQKEKVDINNRYMSEEEIRKDLLPYKSYFACMENTFDFKNISSVCDVGCATGHLLYFIKDKYNIDIKGYEYFDYHKKSEYFKIKNDIVIYDIRDKLSENTKKYDIVNCSEVGEHIEKEYADVLIENAKLLSNKYIIFTWSSHGGENERHCDPNHQHLNPLKRDAYIKLMQKHNLKQNIELTNKFLNESIKHKQFYPWWRESFIIWEI